jgi:predicted nucleic acid-binding Zn ribbon protein
MKADIADNEQRIAVHEAVCAERYGGIQERLRRGDKRMQRIEYILYFLVVAVVGGREVAMKVVELFAK